jgi:two-component system, sensor histidine kinase YesM
VKKTIFMPLAQQFFILICIFIICTLGIILYRTYDYTKLQTSYMDNSLESYSAQVNKSTNESYEFYENICYSVGYNQLILKFLSSKEKNKSLEQYQQVSNLFYNTALLNPYIIDIAVYGQNNTFAALYGSADKYRLFAVTLSDSRFSIRSAGITKINNVLCHVLAIPVYSLDTGESHYLGILFVSIDINNLFSKSLDVNKDESKYNPKILFANEEGILIYGDSDIYKNIPHVSETREVFQITADNVRYAAAVFKIPSINHTLYVLIDKSQNTRQLFKISYHLILSMLILIIFFLLLLIMFYRPLISSLNQLIQFMRKVSSGNIRAYKEGPHINQGIFGSSEIEEISSAFNTMLTEIDHLNHSIFDTYTRMYELEANNRKTEIAFLRSQVNPHFLYNTLTMICGMASEGDNDKIIGVTSALSQIFRYSIKGNDMVTLREEMDIVKSYLMIQKERFEDRFTVRFEFFEESLDWIIPKMVIQPLVENAIVHGLEKSLTTGELLIGAGRNTEFGYLAIWVFDTGVGIPKEKLEELRCTIQNSSGFHSIDKSDVTTESVNKSTDSIGLLNVNSRMILYYGNDYSLILDSEEGVGTNVQLRIPYKID